MLDKTTLIAVGNNFIAVYTKKENKILMRQPERASQEELVLFPVVTGSQEPRTIISLDVDCKDTISWYVCFVFRPDVWL